MPVVIPGVSLPHGGNVGAPWSDVPRGDVCFGTVPDFLGRGNNLRNIAFEQFCHLPKNISSPLLSSVDV